MDFQYHENAEPNEKTTLIVYQNLDAYIKMLKPFISGKESPSQNGRIKKGKLTNLIIENTSEKLTQTKAIDIFMYFLWLDSQNSMEKINTFSIDY